MPDNLRNLTQKFVNSISEIIERDLKARVKEEIARLTSNLGTLRDSGRRAPVRRGSRPGRKLDMACRYPGCKNRSKGPRFHFLCEDHLKTWKKGKAGKGKGAAQSGA